MAKFISYNVRDIRSFSGTKWKKNLGEGRAEPRTVYPLLYEGERNGVERKRSVPEAFESVPFIVLKSGAIILYSFGYHLFNFF